MNLMYRRAIDNRETVRTVRELQEYESGKKDGFATGKAEGRRLERAALRRWGNTKQVPYIRREIVRLYLASRKRKGGK